MRKLLLLALLLCTTAAGVRAQGDVRPPDLPKNRTRYTDYTEKAEGYWTAVQVTAQTTAMFKRKNMQGVGADWVNGYRFNEFLRVGVGVGARYYVNHSNVRRSDIAWSFPIYLDARGNIISQQDRGAVPYWSVDVGGEIRGGFYFSPTLGYRFGIMRGSVLVGVSYVLQQADTWRRNKESLSNIGLKIGYEF